MKSQRLLNQLKESKPSAVDTDFIFSLQTLFGHGNDMLLVAMTYNHNNTHTHIEKTFCQNLPQKRLMNKQFCEKEHSFTKQINSRCQLNDMRELNHFGEQSGISIPHKHKYIATNCNLAWWHRAKPFLFCFSFFQLLQDHCCPDCLLVRT